MNRPWHIALVFALCLAVVFAAMGWITVRALEADRERSTMQTEQALGENTRQALGRMEQTLATLVVRETARPYFWYRSFYVPERAYTRMFNPVAKGDVLVPSPLLVFSSPEVLLHFQIGPDGKMTSPQAPTGNERDMAESAYVTPAQIDASAALLAELQNAVDPAALLAALPAKPFKAVDAAFSGNTVAQSTSRASRDVQQKYSKSEQMWRNRRNDEQMAQVQLSDNRAWQVLSDVHPGEPKPIWLGDNLLFARRVTVGNSTYVQGAWLNWPHIRDELLSETRDLLPHAKLQPVRKPANADDDARVLAQLPIRLLPGTLDADQPNGLSPYELSIIGGWGSVLLAALAAGLLLRGMIVLSERRASFVSSVTHELRTPLTTFRMYTEMLSRNMVPDPDKRQRYLDTLQSESERLSHLVENVLSYARLERNRSGGHIETVSVAELLSRTTERLGSRAEQAEMELRIDDTGEELAAEVRADVSAVEQILFNLVDNACKYAATATDRTIHIDAGRKGRLVAIRVCDHGPGISSGDARRLFRPFCKSAHDAANSAPGVGLGLTLSRRLARDMGGDLRCDAGRDDGACFVLTLPAA
jgi:signal transduction histidine kinase